MGTAMSKAQMGSQTTPLKDLQVQQTRLRSSGTSTTTQVGDFASSSLSPRGCLHGAEGLKVRVQSNPNFLSATPSAVLRPPFFNDRGPFGPKRRNQDRGSLAHMKEVQLAQLEVFRRAAAFGDWPHVHAGHYDWWMFPIDDGRKDEYVVFADDVLELRSDAEWSERYLEAVALVARAWGWDLNLAQPAAPHQPGMQWTGWDVRLAKIIRSLWLFGHKAELESMQKFARVVKPDGGLRYGRINLDEVFFMTLSAEPSEASQGRV